MVVFLAMPLLWLVGWLVRSFVRSLVDSAAPLLLPFVCQTTKMA
jgi:hypothetical protein